MRVMVRGASAVLAAALVTVLPAGAEPALPPVYMVEVSGEVDLGVASLVERAVREAESAGAAMLLVRVDTPGGRVDAALRMRSALIGAQVPTVAFVDREALSAGALVALSADQVWFAPGAVLGAATPVYADGRAADEKMVSALRAIFRATALEKGRDPQVAEGMVDPQVAVEGLAPSGTLVTLDLDQAKAAGYADGAAMDLDALLDALLDDHPLLEGLAVNDLPLVLVSPAPAELLARVVTGPLVAGLLLSVGVWLLVNSLLRSGGAGLGVPVGAAFIGLFLFGHSLAGLAGRESFLLVGAGLLLLAVEVVVLPGFGVFGVAGIAMLMVGAALALYDPSYELVPAEAFRSALSTVSVSVATALLLVVVSLLLLSRFAQDPRFSRRAKLVLASSLPPPPGAKLPQGCSGVALTDLRPSGMADFDGSLADVVAEEGFLPSGTPVTLVSDEGYRRLVRRSRP